MRIYTSYDSDELLILLAANDEQAFTEIYNRFWKKLFVIANNRIKDTELAEDVVHDVFVSLWANRSTAKIQALENYLASATKYLVLAKIKKIERERLHKTTHPGASIIELPIEDSLHYKHLLEIVKDEIENLPERCRLIFKYSRNEHMAVKEIAEHLNISSKTVENQINKALKQLRVATKTFLHFFL
ncbi:MAG: RNA polymerase sigma-70 factor [Ginsengibacter sp.]